MSVLSREDFMNRLNALIGEDDSDESLATMEDFTDTFDHYHGLVDDKEDWKAKYEENDKQWRTKYRERFNSGHNDETEIDEEEKEENEPTKFEDLFNESEG